MGKSELAETPAVRSTFIELDEEALLNNLNMVRATSPGCMVCAMVKANAYGHGLVEMSRLLVHHGVEMLGVAFLDEADLLRQLELKSSILVTTPLLPEEADRACELGVQVVVDSNEQIIALNSAGARSNQKVKIHLYVDTGMHRDGFALSADWQWLPSLLAKTNWIELAGVCTHFGSSDVPNCTRYLGQVQRFQEFLDMWEGAGITFPLIHCDNSGALWQSVRVKANLIRPGLALYGYASAPHIQDLQPVLSLKSRVLSIRNVSAGQYVAYGTMYQAMQDETIATVPIGYGDGYNRGLSNRANCLINGKAYPLVGVICMDECLVRIDDGKVAVGDEVVLIGASGEQVIRVRNLSDILGTIPYEVTTALTERVPRIVNRRNLPSPYDAFHGMTNV